MGVLSGMLPRAYSVTINWAPPAAFPTFDFGPGFLLRDTLETCDNYESAVDTLTRTRLSTSVFFTVCGTEKDQACVIERTQAQRLSAQWQDPCWFSRITMSTSDSSRTTKICATSRKARKSFLLKAAPARRRLSPSRWRRSVRLVHSKTLARVLDVTTVLNKLTCQQMVFCPRSGDVKVCGPRTDVRGRRRSLGRHRGMSPCLAS